MTSTTILRCSSAAHIGQDLPNSVNGPPWWMVLPLGSCHGPSGSNNSFSVFRSPSLSAVKTRLTTDLLCSTVDSRPADWATAEAATNTMRITQSSLRIEDSLSKYSSLPKISTSFPQSAEIVPGTLSQWCCHSPKYKSFTPGACEIDKSVSATGVRFRNGSFRAALWARPRKLSGCQKAKIGNTCDKQNSQ